MLWCRLWFLPGSYDHLLQGSSRGATGLSRIPHRCPRSRPTPEESSSSRLGALPLSVLIELLNCSRLGPPPTSEVAHCRHDSHDAPILASSFNLCHPFISLRNVFVNSNNHCIYCIIASTCANSRRIELRWNPRTGLPVSTPPERSPVQLGNSLDYQSSTRPTRYINLLSVA